MQREYGCVNVTGTILSKRRIAIIVEGITVEKKNSDGTIEKVIPPTVRDWGDSRLYTLVALRRRGIPAKALLNSLRNLASRMLSLISKFSVSKRRPAAILSGPFLV